MLNSAAWECAIAGEIRGERAAVCRKEICVGCCGGEIFAVVEWFNIMKTIKYKVGQINKEYE